MPNRVWLLTLDEIGLRDSPIDEVISPREGAKKASRCEKRKLWQICSGITLTPSTPSFRVIRNQMHIALQSSPSIAVAT